MIEANTSIANAYINTNEPVFGTIGVVHVKEIQEILLNTSALSNQDVCFFHLYSTPETLMEKNKQQATHDHPDLERILRTEANYFAMPVKSINVTELKEEEIIKIIITKIDNHLAIKNIKISGSPLYQNVNVRDVQSRNEMTEEENKRFSLDK